jgi:hypothetical protein
MTKLIVWASLISIGHVTLIKGNSFGSETRLITQNLKPEKGCVIEKFSSPSNKENGTVVISKMTVANCLETTNRCLFWISSTMV